MKVTIEMALNATEALKEFEKKELPAKLAYSIAMLESKLSPITSSYRKVVNDLIVNKYGVKIEGTQNFKVPEETLADFQQEITSILMSDPEEIELNKIKMEHFEDIKVSKDFFLGIKDFIE